MGTLDDKVPTNLEPQEPETWTIPLPTPRYSSRHLSEREKQYRAMKRAYRAMVDSYEASAHSPANNKPIGSSLAAA